MEAHSAAGPDQRLAALPILQHALLITAPQPVPSLKSPVTVAGSVAALLPVASPAEEAWPPAEVAQRADEQPATEPAHCDTDGVHGVPASYPEPSGVEPPPQQPSDPPHPRTALRRERLPTSGGAVYGVGFIPPVHIPAVDVVAAAVAMDVLKPEATVEHGAAVLPASQTSADAQMEAAAMAELTAAAPTCEAPADDARP